MKVAAARAATPRTLRKSDTLESTVPLVSLAAIYGVSVESQRTGVALQTSYAYDVCTKFSTPKLSLGFGSDPAEGSNRVLTLGVSIPTEIRFRKLAQRS